MRDQLVRELSDGGFLAPHTRGTMLPCHAMPCHAMPYELRALVLPTERTRMQFLEMIDCKWPIIDVRWWWEPEGAACLINK